MFVHHMRAHNKYAVVLGAIKAKPVGGRRMGAASLDRSCAPTTRCVDRGEETAARSNKEPEG